MRFTAVVILLFVGCQAPTTAHAVFGKTRLHRDGVQDRSWIMGPEIGQKFLRTEGLDGPGEPRHELHIRLYVDGWANYDQAETDDGTPVGLTVVERRVLSGKIKIESFFVHLSTEDLRQNAETKRRYRVLGDRESQTLWISLPPYYYEGYLRFLEQETSE